MSKTISIFKGLGWAYILTLIALLVYNTFLTFTKLTADNIGIVISFITIFSSAFGGFYACRQIKQKGLLYGFLEGFLYILILLILVFLARESFSFEMSLLYNLVFITLAGGIGGIIGVNFR